MDTGGLVLIGLTLLAALVLVGVGMLTFSRFAGPSYGRSQSVPCCYRPGAEESWRKGTLRYDLDRLDHYGGSALSMRPDHRWLRSRLDLGIARPMDSPSCPALPTGVTGTSVSCRYGEESFELALGHQHYTALRAWLESVPPGWNANVA